MLSIFNLLEIIQRVKLTRILAEALLAAKKKIKIRETLIRFRCRSNRKDIPIISPYPLIYTFRAKSCSTLSDSVPTLIIQT